MGKRKNPGKGGAFERSLCKTFSLWGTKGTDKTQLIRSVLSGGWKEKDQSWRQLGDLAPNGLWGTIFRKHFVVEAKHRASVDFWHIYTSKPGENILGWWGKLCREIDDHDFLDDLKPLPLLVWRANNRPIMLASHPSILQGPKLLTLKVKGFQSLGIVPLDDFLLLPSEHYFQRFE